MKRLNDNEAFEVSRSIVEAMEEAGYSVEETIPGLVQAIVDLAGGDEQLLDEAANLLADGGVYPPEV